MLATRTKCDGGSTQQNHTKINVLLRQGSMCREGPGFPTALEEQFHAAVFTQHSKTSPNLQIVPPWTVPAQMELEGYELVNRAIQWALDVRREVNSHP